MKWMFCFNELDEKHNEKFSVEELHMWAHLVNMGKHKSLDIPPDKPFFRGNKKKSPTLSEISTSTDISPIKRSNLRSQYITQMRYWHALFEVAAIIKEEYEDQKARILKKL